MWSGSRRPLGMALISGLLLGGPPTLAQASPAWVDPPSGPNDLSLPESAAPLRSAQPPQQPASESNPLMRREDAARHLAFDYLNLWSAPNQVTLESASSFYGPTVTFHGRTRTLASVVAEKRRFVERWPNRIYHHRPETTQVLCEADGAHCTVWSIFEFSASNSRAHRHANGIGEHELVVSFVSGGPVIESENSRVVRRGRGNMSWLLKTEVARCGEVLETRARELGAVDVNVSSAGSEVQGRDGELVLPINARIEYALNGLRQVREARLGCRMNTDGQVVGIE